MSPQAGCPEPQATPLQPGAHRTAQPLWRSLAGLALGLALVAVAARGIDLPAVWEGLRKADPLGAGLALLAVLATTAAKVARWWSLFPKGARPGLLALARALLVGQLTNALLPVRLGEVAQAYLVGREQETSGAAALGTVAAGKALDVLFLLLCSGLAALTAPLPRWLAVSLAGFAAVGTVIFLLAAVLPQRRLVDWAGQWTRGVSWKGLERLPDALQRGLSGLAVLREPHRAAIACTWSAVVWALAAGTNALLFDAFDLRIPLGAAVWLLVLLHVGVAPPSSPGRLGVFHALTLWGLTTFEVEPARGLAYATLLHALVYGPQVVLGGVALGWVRRAQESASSSR